MNTLIGSRTFILKRLERQHPMKCSSFVKMSIANISSDKYSKLSPRRDISDSVGKKSVTLSIFRLNLLNKSFNTTSKFLMAPLARHQAVFEPKFATGVNYSQEMALNKPRTLQGEIAALEREINRIEGDFRQSDGGVLAFSLPYLDYFAALTITGRAELDGTLSLARPQPPPGLASKPTPSVLSQTRTSQFVLCLI